MEGTSGSQDALTALDRLAARVEVFGSLAEETEAVDVGIGFGLQNAVNNFVSGLILIFEAPIQVGDTVEVGELMGKVVQIGIRTSKVRTYRRGSCLRQQSGAGDRSIARRDGGESRCAR
jgi:small-conductance mechanosensitive channel